MGVYFLFSQSTFTGGKQKHPRKQGKSQYNNSNNNATTSQNSKKPQKKKIIPEQKLQNEEEYYQSDEEDGTRIVNLVIDKRTGLMDDDFQVSVDAEQILKLKSCAEVDIFDEVKFEQDLKEIPNWCIGGIDPDEVLDKNDKINYQVDRKMKRFVKEVDPFDEVILFKSGNKVEEKKAEKEEVLVEDKVVGEKEDSIDELEDWLDDVL